MGKRVECPPYGRTRQRRQRPPQDSPRPKSHRRGSFAALGTGIVRELTEVISFKSKIEQFQRHLLNDKSKVVDVEIRDINKQLAEFDRRYSKLAAVLDQEGQLRNLRQTYASFQAKSDELGQLKSFFSRYDQLLIDRQTKKSEIEAERLMFQASISSRGSASLL